MRFTCLSDIENLLAEASRDGDTFSTGDFLKPYHLVLLPVLLKNYRSLKLSPELEGYAIRMGLYDMLGVDAPRAVFKNSPGGKFLPIRQLKFQKDVDDVADNLGNVIFSHTSTDEKTKDAVRITLRELLENCFCHAARNDQDELLVYASAQTWPNGHLAQIAIADSGVGIRLSLSHNEQLSQQLESCNACQLATEYSITGKPHNEHSGYGVTLANDLMSQCNGNLIIVSGTEGFNNADGIPNEDNFNIPLNGSIVIIEWKLGDILDIKKVYENWPLAEGFTPDDFFKIKLKNKSRKFTSHDDGKKVRAYLLDLLQQHSTIEIDLAELIMTPSFADECFGVLARMLGKQNFQNKIKFINVKPETKSLITSVIAHQLSMISVNL